MWAVPQPAGMQQAISSLGVLTAGQLGDLYCPLYDNGA